MSRRCTLALTFAVLVVGCDREPSLGEGLMRIPKPDEVAAQPGVPASAAPPATGTASNAPAVTPTASAEP